MEARKWINENYGSKLKIENKEYYNITVPLPEPENDSYQTELKQLLST